MEGFRIDDMAKRLFETLPPAFRAAQRDMENNFRSVLRSGLGKLDLVPRDEFDAQAKVLARTREMVEKLEARITELEARQGIAPPPSSSEGARPAGTPEG